ncbi:MAG TPA: hypothetical protein VIE65_21040 [Methylobacter sp.]
MKQSNNKTLTISILIALASTSNTWADSGSSASGVAGSVATSTAIVALSTNNPSAAANATDAAANGSGNASSDHSNRSVADTPAQGSAAANNGSSAFASTDNSLANSNGIGSAVANNSGTATTVNNDNADRSQASSNGIGSAAANNGGTATSNYRVSNQNLSGTVTGNSSILPTSTTTLSSLPIGNNIDHSLVGNAGITQTFQNSGMGLAQQSVAVDGTVSATQGTAAIAP